MTPAVEVEDRIGLTALIFDVMRFAIHDGPGIRTTVFFKGCPLACAWCHNPESQAYRPDILYSLDRCLLCGDCAAACPEHAIERVNGHIHTSTFCRRCGFCLDFCQTEARQIAGRRVALAELVREVERDLVFFDESGGGVTLSGGEPLSQARFVRAFLDACRERRIHTVLETSGFADRKTIMDVACRANIVLYDLKFATASLHRQFTGTSNARIIENLQVLIAAGANVIVRIPVLPGLNDNDDEAEGFAAVLTAAGASRVELLPYHRTGGEKYRKLGRDYQLTRMPDAGPADLRRFGEALARRAADIQIGGMT